MSSFVQGGATFDVRLLVLPAFSVDLCDEIIRGQDDKTRFFPEAVQDMSLMKMLILFQLYVFDSIMTSDSVKGSLGFQLNPY